MSLSSQTSKLLAIVKRPSVYITTGTLLLFNVYVLAFAQGHLPLYRPSMHMMSAQMQLLNGDIALIEVMLLSVIVWFATRKRLDVPNIADRAPKTQTAKREVIGLIGYGIALQLLGVLLGKLLGWHALSFHLAGSMYGLGTLQVAPSEAFGWMAYNFIGYAVIPYLYFRRRYSLKQLGLHSINLRRDIILITLILGLEVIFETLAGMAGVFKLSLHQALLGIPLTFVIYMLGTTLPTMIFVYSILLPRYLKLTGLRLTAAILAGVTYTLLHIFDVWTAYGTLHNGMLSIIFLTLLYFGPGVFKAILTIRTGNAWVHVWAYHIFVPHIIGDTPVITDIFKIKP